MIEGNTLGKVLRDHKKVGKKLIPPMLQMKGVELTSFINGMLPNLVWMSALFLRLHPKKAVDSTLQFTEAAENIIRTANLSKPPGPLVLMGNLANLDDNQKSLILNELRGTSCLTILRSQLKHQAALLERYPLSFIYEDPIDGASKKSQINKLKEDVDSLLDRHNSLATYVQVTAIVSMMTTGKMVVSSKINLPDFNAIFTAPGSADARRAASFARASLNAGSGMYEKENSNAWCSSFWEQAFDLERCK